MHLKEEDMKALEINQLMEDYRKNGEIAGGALLVRKNNEIVFDGKWGYADIKKKMPVTDYTIFRMASMTKCVTGVAIMKLIEEGKIGLDDPLEEYLPEFGNMRVCADDRYVFKPGMSMASLLPKMIFFSMDKVKSVPADREVTIRDLLSHASGLQQGVVGMIAMMKHNKKDTLKQRVEAYSRYVLDFQPGTGTGYSPCAAFDILGYLIGLITGKDIKDAYRELVFEPLDMKSAAFCLTEQQKPFLAHTYTRKKEQLVDITGTKKDLEGILRIERGSDYVAGSGGLYCTVKDYEKLGHMLCNEGAGFLRPETVKLMHTEAQAKHLEPEPGYTWGLSVKIRQDKSKGQFPCTEGTYGWSGALGTHFFVSPKDKLDVVFATHRADLGGSGSYISRKIEELVFGIWGENDEI